MKLRMRQCVVTLCAAIVFAALVVSDVDPGWPQADPVRADPIVAAAGDIACDQRPNAPPDDDSGSLCHMAGTYAVLKSLHVSALLTLGDEQYEESTYDQFLSSYDKTWGRLKAITHPAPGNHEYDTPGAEGYYRYFGAAAGDPAKGYYSFDLRSWHLIAINANCRAIGGCQKGSPQERWLAADLSAHRAACTLAYWHQPRFSSAKHHSDSIYTDLWSDLYRAGADVVLNGHDHDYERFAPQTPTGQGDPRNGIREFVIGTGGKSHYPFTKIEPNSEVRNSTTFGVLVLTLHSHGYSWRFLPEPGSQFTDTGSQACHSRS